MDENKNIVPYQPSGLIPRVANTLKITDKILAKKDQELIPYRKGKKWGFCTPDKNIVIDCEFDNVLRFTEGLARVMKNNKWGYIDMSGNIKFALNNSWARPFHEGFAAVSMPDKWCFINQDGQIIFSDFQYLNDFYDGLAAIGHPYELKYGFIDHNGNFKFHRIYDFDRSEESSFYQEQYLHRDMTEVIDSFRFYEGLVTLKKKNKYGFHDKEGHLITPFIYDYADIFSNGLALVVKENPQNELDRKLGYIDKTGDLIIPFKYQFMRSWESSRFSEGLILVTLNYNSFFININNQVVIPNFGYEFIAGFSEGLALVMDKVYKNSWQYKSKYGFIDKMGDLAIPCEFDDSSDIFSDGLSIVIQGDKRFFINKFGEKVIDCKDNITYRKFINGLSSCVIHEKEGEVTESSDGKYGYIDKNGTEFWED